MSRPLLAALLASTALSAQAPASRPGFGDLMVSPSRLIFEGSQRSAELRLVNRGSETTTYRIAFVQMVMEEDGSMRELPARLPGGRYADDLLLYSPKQVTLPPGVTQTIRLALQKPVGLPMGEYRSHLTIRALPPAVPGPQPTEGRGGIDVKMTPVYGIAVPVIVRHRTTVASAAWEDLRLFRGDSPALEAVLFRSGNQSLYGHVQVHLIPPDGAAPLLVAAQDWVAVYDGLARRRFTLPLTLPEGARGVLRLTLAAPESGNPLAQAQLELP